jgi:hypothetical protein
VKKQSQPIDLNPSNHIPFLDLCPGTSREQAEAKKQYTFLKGRLLERLK